MSACPQCGTPSKPTDKFCNSCGFSLQRSGGPGLSPAALSPMGAPQGFPPPMPPPPRCAQGHEIAPGASYCQQGHPIAIDAMSFGADPFSPPPAYPAPQPGGFGAPPPAPFGGNPQFGGPGPTAPPPFGGFGQPSPAPFGQPDQGFGGQQGGGGFNPPPAPSPGHYAATASPFGPPGGGYAPAPSPGVFNPAAVPPPFAGGQMDAQPNVPAKIIRGFLVTYQPNPAGDAWTLTGGRHMIGRVGAADGIDIALADPTISSRHGVLHVDAASGSIVIEDTGSTNGTFVNDEHLAPSGKRELRDGDRIRFGGLLTVVKIVGRL